jgi:hypothetical protein
MYWQETVTKADLAEKSGVWGLLFYAFPGNKKHPVLKYRLRIPPLTRDTKADGTSPVQDWKVTHHWGEAVVLPDYLYCFIPWFRPEFIHGDRQAIAWAEHGATRIRGSRTAKLGRVFMKHGGRLLVDKAIVSWDLRWHPPGKVPELPADEPFDPNSELGQLQDESEWLEDELQGFEESATSPPDVINWGSPGAPDRKGDQKTLDQRSQRIEKLWQNRRALKIDQVDVQPAIDANAAVRKSGQNTAPMSSAKLFTLHGLLTGIMQYALPSSSKQQADAPPLPPEQIRWLSRLQTAHDLVDRTVELRMRFAANRIRAVSQKREKKEAFRTSR